MTQDQWVLQCVAGLEIEFLELPVSISNQNSPAELHVSWGQGTAQKGAAPNVTRRSNRTGFSEQGPKGLPFNHVCDPQERWEDQTGIQPQEPESIHQSASFHTAKEIIRPRDWLTKIDLKDAFQQA